MHLISSDLIMFTSKKVKLCWYSRFARSGKASEVAAVIAAGRMIKISYVAPTTCWRDMLQSQLKLLQAYRPCRQEEEKVEHWVSQQTQGECPREGCAPGALAAADGGHRGSPGPPVGVVPQQRVACTFLASHSDVHMRNSPSEVRACRLQSACRFCHDPTETSDVAR